MGAAFNTDRVNDDRREIVQVTLVQLDNYGPWTVTPQPRREADLQSLQARLFADVSEFLGTRGGYTFTSRYDNMLAVTNDISRDDHRRLQVAVRNRYPITVSLGVGRANRPATAVENATRVLRSAGSAQDADRQEALGFEGGSGMPSVTIAHFDVVEATERLTDRVNAYEVQLTIDRATAELARHLLEDHDALTFFVGGDNAIAVCPELTATDFRRAIGHVEAITGLGLRVGVGRGRTSADAGMEAKHALEKARRRDHRVVLTEPDQVGP